MKRTIVAFSIAAALMLALTGCQKGNTPEQEAVLQLISRSSGEVKGAFFTSFEKVDSTTLRTALSTRHTNSHAKASSWTEAVSSARTCTSISLRTERHAAMIAILFIYCQSLLEVPLLQPSAGNPHP